MTVEQASYYAPTAYRSDNIPEQLPSEERSWLKRFGKRRLPWGYTLDIAPDDFLQERSPDKLRFQEKMFKERDEKMAAGTYVPAPYEHVDFHNRHDHQQFRFSLWSTRSQFWLHLLIFGKGFFLVGLAPLLFALVAAIYTLPNTPIEIAMDTLKYVFPWVTGLPLLCWAIGSLVIHKFPKLWVKPSRGPIWELNRRTGLVTLFDYKNNGEYKKNGTIGELTAPFYEFDAYIVSVAERQGSMNHVLFLAHRYRDIVIDFSALVNLDNRWQMPCALWDFLQNYMDTSGPLPELPRYEEFRHLDPATAAYDQQTCRPPRFWIDMDDATYKRHLDHLLDSIDAIDTFQRPNLMAQYVQYVD
ncbi:hypothetical protein [Pseudomonas quasicaspiana]|uniref:hypothetical protein n=1 Tax=Pseudomonas quasicaspiana TaxID=2829821 RepID=UPI001E2E5A3E|nr:hypothetical protein [Pseudomonas quasicaspiana]